MSFDNEFLAGWRILLASFLGIALGLSSLYFYSLGIFIKPLAAEFGWSRGEASMGVLVGTLCSAVVSMPTGQLVDRIGAVKVGVISLLLLALGLAGLGLFTVGLTSFLAVTAVLSLLTTGSTGVSFTRLVVTNFDRHRGLALGIVLSGAGLGAILIPPLLTPFVAQHGWRHGYYALATIIAIMLPIIWLALRGQESLSVQADASLPIGDIVMNPAFVLIGAIFLAASTSIIGTVVHFVPMLTDLGLSPAKAGQTASLIGVAAIGGRLVAGFLLDRLPAALVTGCLFLLAASGLTTLALGGVEVIALGALITGLAIGAEVDLMAFLVSRYFPRAVFGQAYGSLYALFLIGGAIGPASYGYFFDWRGDYHLALLFGASLLVLAALGAGLLGKLTPYAAEHAS